MTIMMMMQTRLTDETSLFVSSLTPYTLYRVTVACIPTMRDADGKLVLRGFWSEAASTVARTLPDGIRTRLSVYFITQIYA